MRRLTGMRAYRAWRPSALVVAFAVGALLVIAACGGEKKGEATGTTAGMGESSGGAKLVVELGDFYFKPDKFAVKAGTPVKFIVKNEGKVEHSFTLPDVGKGMKAEIRMKAGETKELPITFNDVGTFKLVCAVPGHLDSGMKGEVTVVK